MFEFFTFAFLSSYLEFLSFSLQYFRAICLSVISDKNPTISISPSYSGLETSLIVIYITKIKHWVEISRFWKLEILEIRGIKFCGWQKILIFPGIKFCDLAKKIAKLRNFIPTKIYGNKVSCTLRMILWIELFFLLADSGAISFGLMVIPTLCLWLLSTGDLLQLYLFY